MCVASSVLWQDMKWAIFENLSTTTKIESILFLDLDKPKTNSMEISTQSALGTSKGVYNPNVKTLDLDYLHEAHALSISHFIFG